MKTLHIAPSDTAGGALARALFDAGRDEGVLSNRDDLSCGPIDAHDHSTRASWWRQFHDLSEVEASLKRFWERVLSGDDRLVVWFGRRSALEIAFFLAFADRLGERPYDIVDVTGLRLAFSRPDGSPALIQSTPAVSVVPPEGLSSMLGSERPIRLPSHFRWFTSLRGHPICRQTSCRRFGSLSRRPVARRIRRPA